LKFWGHSEPSGGAAGQASDIAIRAQEIIKVRSRLIDIYQVRIQTSLNPPKSSNSKSGTFYAGELC